MAMPIRKTLGELREALLGRVGIGSVGANPAGAMPVLDERIRQAQTLLLTRFDWTALWTSTEVPLDVGVAEYDWPDGVGDPSDLVRISVKRADDGFLHELKPISMRPNERNAAYPYPQTDPNAFSCPLVYTIQNQVIRLGPAPDEQWTSMLMEYFLTANAPLVDAGDRCACDPEALLMQAEILVKEHFGMPVGELMRSDLKQYLMDLQGKQGDGDGFQLGGRQSVRNLPQIRNRVVGAPFPSGNHLSW